MTRIAIVATSPVVRAGLEALVATSPALTVVGAVPEPEPGSDAGAGASPLLDAVAALDADVIVWAPGADRRDGEPGSLDLVADRREGRVFAAAAPATERPAAARGAPAVVVLADRPDAEWTTAALRAGVRAVLPREATAAELVAAVSAAAAGLTTLPADLAADLAAAAAPPRPASPPSDGDPVPLTPRELEVLALLAEGLPNKAIAPRLGISEHTVKAHVTAIFAKLHAGTRAEAVVTAARRGLLML